MREKEGQWKEKLKEKGEDGVIVRKRESRREILLSS